MTRFVRFSPTALLAVIALFAHFVELALISGSTVTNLVLLNVGENARILSSIAPSAPVLPVAARPLPVRVRRNASLDERDNDPERDWEKAVRDGAGMFCLQEDQHPPQSKFRLHDCGVLDHYGWVEVRSTKDAPTPTDLNDALGALGLNKDKPTFVDLRHQKNFVNTDGQKGVCEDRGNGRVVRC